ncbi:hypothetical protein MNB_SV-6-582 [hydrothermal vent metagenome]|uniref:Uncharacterized protein n=1 Tax=hydrothermal vent metagenome TaxID=652676 RepID=A0A1W1CBZ0_9ZZZZ
MKKFAPLIILGIFLAGIVWMIFGMKSAMDMADHTKVKKIEATLK